MKVVRIVPHEESIEVRVSTFIYFDDNPGRRSINGRVSRDQAVEQAKQIARAEDGRPSCGPTGDGEL